MGTFKRVLKWTLILLLLVVAGLAIWIGPMTYRALVGYKIYETVPPELPADIAAPAVLIFSKTNGFRSEEQIDATNAALVAMAKREGWSYFVTENAAVFNPAQLAQFQAVVFNSVSGDVFTPQQRADFKTWLEQGGGYVGLHGAGGDVSYDWAWYVDELIGAQFIGHTLGPQIQEARLVIEDQEHPATRGLGTEWVRSDEWYSFASNPRDKGYHVLVSIDESSYSPVDAMFPFVEPTDISMGDHPLVWTHCVGQGRALYSALGHSAEMYSEPKHLQLIQGAIAWAARLDGTGCEADPAESPAP